MLLRASGERSGHHYDVSAVSKPGADPGVAGAAALRALAEAAVGGSGDMQRVRDAAVAAIGRQQTVDALTVAAAFNGITRVADATGIPLDEHTESVTEELRAQVGINAFSYAAKSERYSG